MTMANPRRVLLDTDPGIDDALAILLGLASPEIELVALSVVHGNCPLPDAVRNALAVLALGSGGHVPVAVGCARPLLRAPYTAQEIHGDAGLGYARLPPAPFDPIAEHAVDLLIREIMSAPGEVTLCAVGPLTNIALALRKEPRIVEHVRELIFMGGAFRADGNATPLAEFNVYADPHAAQIVFESGMPIVVMPWDITKEVRISFGDVERLQARGGTIPALVAEATRFYMEFHQAHFGYAGCAVNDPAALALAWMPELAELTPLAATVETTSELTMGKTIGDFLNKTGAAPNIQLVTAFDTPRFIDLFLRRLGDLTERTAGDGLSYVDE
jgi:purine nucleosidase